MLNTGHYWDVSPLALASYTCQERKNKHAHKCRGTTPPPPHTPGNSSIDVRNDNLIRVVPEVERTLCLCGALELGSDGEYHLISTRLQRELCLGEGEREREGEGEEREGGGGNRE